MKSRKWRAYNGSTMDDNCDSSGFMVTRIYRLRGRKLNPSVAGYCTDHNSDKAH